MPDTPGDGGRDQRDFGWLYGSKDGSAAPSEDATRPVRTGPPAPSAGGGVPDDATRVIPTGARPAAGAAGAAGAAPGPTPTQPRRTQPVTPPPAPPGGTPTRAAFGRPRFRFRLRWLLVLLLLWVVYLVAVPLIAWNKVDQVAFEPSGSRPDDQPGTTYLLVGSDSRGDLTPEQRKAYHTGNASGQRTDTIMLLHTGSGPNLLMSIPRDSLVDVPGHGTTKINAAFAYGGPKLLVRTIEENTGIRVDQYVEIGIGGFVDLVDAVGGITICPTEPMKDPLAGLDITKGCQDADGVTALGFARSRHTSNLGDLARAQHQRQVVSAVGDKVLSPWSVLNPVRYWNLNMAAVKTVAVGDGMSAVRAALWASAMTRVNGESGLTCTVPISDLAVHWDPSRSKQMFQAIIDDDTEAVGKNLCTPSGLPR